LVDLSFRLRQAGDCRQTQDGRVEDKTQGQEQHIEHSCQDALGSAKGGVVAN
jgi:hypothetical protein